MDSTSKGGKKAREAAESSKATAAKSSKAANKTKARAANGGSSGDVTHPPVIITDGSAAIGFVENFYPPAGGNLRKSTGLRIDRVEANKKHDDDRFLCYQLSDGEKVRIEVTCRVGDDEERGFIIGGGNSSAAGHSPELDFDGGIYTPETAGPARRKFRNADRQIVSLKIFSPPNNRVPVHDCSVVLKKKNYEITVYDLHLTDDHDH